MKHLGVKKLKKKKNRYTTFENVVVFPGTVERLVFEGQEFVKNNQFEQANECFEEALQYTEGDEFLLSLYAYSLYEAKSFQEAKEICERLLKIGPSMYIEVMELYLTICMQLKEYHHVEKIITSLIEEGLVPSDKLEKFERLKELNANIYGQLEKQDEGNIVVKQYEEEQFEPSIFLSLDYSEQVNLLHELNFANIRPIVPQLKEIVENEETHPFIKSLILVLFKEQQVDMEVIVEKFNIIRKINPVKIGLPTDLPQYKMISNMVIDKLQQEPSILEMVEYLIAKHSIITYPFEWLDFNTEEVAECYIDFVKQMFGQFDESNSKIFDFLQQLERLSELQ